MEAIFQEVCYKQGCFPTRHDNLIISSCRYKPNQYTVGIVNTCGGVYIDLHQMHVLSWLTNSQNYVRLYRISNQVIDSPETPWFQQ